MQRMSHRSGRKAVMVIVILGVLVGGVMAGVLLGPRLAGKHDEAAADNGQAKTKDTQDAQIVLLGEFTVNVRTGGALRYLQAEVALSLSGLPEPKQSSGGHGAPSAATPTLPPSAATPTLPEADAVLAKDRVVAVLSAANFREAGTPEGRETLKRQLAKAIAEALPAYKVREVLFTSFVMQ